MRNCTNCCKYTIDADMREEMIDLLGEFTDVLASLTNFSERLYDQLASDNDACACEYDDDKDEDENAEAVENSADNDDSDVNFLEEFMERLHEFAFDKGMKEIQENGKPGMLIMHAESGPMMQPTAQVMEYIAQHDEEIEVSRLLDDMYLAYSKDVSVPRNGYDFVCGPVFVFKGKPHVDELTSADMVRVMHELEKRKENQRCTNGDTVTGYRL